MRLRPLFRQLRRVLRLLLYYAHVPDPFWARQLATAGLPPRMVRWLPVSRSLVVKDVGMQLGPRHAFVLSALDSVRLLKGTGATFVVDSSGALRCRIGNGEYLITTEEELRILVEIWVLGAYNCLLSGPCTIVDIGMNVGFASLYFAERKDCIVYSFEPVPDTFAAAQRNFALNPSRSSRIKSHNFGLAADDRSVRFAYSPRWKGLTGVRSALPRVKQAGATSFREVNMRNACEVLAEIINAHPDRKLVLKIDCEGSEYEIVDSLHRSGQLERVHALMIEWHELGPLPLAEHLQQAGFALFSFSPHDRWSGMIYAIHATTSLVQVPSH